MVIKFQDKKYAKMEYFIDSNGGRRRSVMALYVKFDVVVIKNDNALFTHY